MGWGKPELELGGDTDAVQVRIVVVLIWGVGGIFPTLIFCSPEGLSGELSFAEECLKEVEQLSDVVGLLK